MLNPGSDSNPHAHSLRIKHSSSRVMLCHKVISPLPKDRHAVDAQLVVVPVEQWLDRELHLLLKWSAMQRYQQDFVEMGLELQANLACH